ncbi:MAG: hypothetical protein K9N51_06400 [Candidatus Pacebacteria bacterium]|nr:hypothetical protein [Candidatus Paceibacterota bacterium]
MNRKLCRVFPDFQEESVDENGRRERITSNDGSLSSAALVDRYCPPTWLGARNLQPPKHGLR